MSNDRNFAEMGKEQLRTACREAGISYGKLNNDGMRAALVAHYEEAAMREKAAEPQDQPETEEPVVLNGVLGSMVQQLTGNGDQTQEEPVAAPAAPRTKTTSTGHKIQKDREEQHGVRRPSAGTICDQVWGMVAKMWDETSGTVRFKDILAKGAENGINEYTVRTQYARWRKFHGIVGRHAD